jgi:HAD superfamily hydrolase (TIGR01509 family)
MTFGNETRALLFDLGRVVVDIDFDRALAAWGRFSQLSPEDLRAKFSHDEPYRRFECGTLAEQHYFAHLADLMALQCDEAAIRAGWNAILVAEIEETMAMIAAARKHVPCYALSNTNPVHLQELRRAFPRVLEAFDKVFCSHEIGCRKPAPESFTRVLQATGMAPAHVLFFDDLEENVAAARACGLQAVVVRGPQDVRDALSERRLL